MVLKGMDDVIPTVAFILYCFEEYYFHMWICIFRVYNDRTYLRMLMLPASDFYLASLVLKLNSLPLMSSVESISLSH